MPFLLSPGVHVSEIDLTTVVPAVSTTVGAIGGVFRWGPVGERILIDTETTLINQFAGPSNLNAETWFTIANFLGYGNQALVVRGANTAGVTPEASFIPSANATVSNNVFVGNTANVVLGMYITQTSNSTMVPAGNTVVVTGVNATAVVLSVNCLTNTAVTLYFGHPGTTYNALGLAPQGVVANLVAQIVKNENDYTLKDGTFDSDITYLAKYPGLMGNSLRVSQCDTTNAYSSNVALIGTQSSNVITGSIVFTIGSNTAVCTFQSDSNSTVASNAFALAVSANISIGDNILAGNTTINQQFLQVAGISAINVASNTSTFSIGFVDPYRLHTAYTSNTISRYWEFFNKVEGAPGQSPWVYYNGNSSANDELHVVVVDDGGMFTGVPGTILEVFKGVSRATDAKNLDNSGNYYKDIINQNSKYIWWGNDRSLAYSANSSAITSSLNYAPADYFFTCGHDGYAEDTAPLSVIATAYDFFTSSEDVDVSLVMQGRPTGGVTVVGGVTVSNFQLANYIIDNVVGIRKDCVAFVSPDKTLEINAFGTEAINLAAWRGAVHDSSYAVMDSGYKYQYDRYNDLYRWIPMNGDIAGLCARTDMTNDPWWSPAGLNRGQIKNLIRLAFNPKQADRDTLYVHGVNPVVTFQGSGTVLYGDKTLQSKPSAFDRINVRRLFIVLEKAISLAAKYSLFEFNDAFTRAQFKNLVTPYLRTVQGRRGITDFLVVCDETNNTPQIIDTNQFVGDIYIKPARSINFIQLNFIAVATGVQFSEVVGKF